MLTRTRRNRVPNFVTDSFGHPQVVTMMPCVFGGGIVRHGTAGLGAVNGTPAQLSQGEVWTSGTHLEWVIGLATDLGFGGQWMLQASTTDDDAVILASGSAGGSNIERGVARLPGEGLRRVTLGLWASGSGVVVAPAAAWYVTNEFS